MASQLIMTFQRTNCAPNPKKWKENCNSCLNTYVIPPSNLAARLAANCLITSKLLAPMDDEESIISTTS